VFAVWATTEPVPEGVLSCRKRSSLVRAARDPETLAFESSERYGYPPGFRALLREAALPFGPRERAGLLSFLELAHEAKARPRSSCASSRRRKPPSGPSAMAAPWGTPYDHLESVRAHARFALTGGVREGGGESCDPPRIPSTRAVRATA
jgi:hypothetical protein